MKGLILIRLTNHVNGTTCQTWDYAFSWKSEKWKIKEDKLRLGVICTNIVYLKTEDYVFRKIWLLCIMFSYILHFVYINEHM